MLVVDAVTVQIINTYHLSSKIWAKAMVFPVAIYGCASWTIGRLSTEELMLSNCGAREDS